MAAPRPPAPADYLDELRRRRSSLQLVSTAERVADVLREQVTAGGLLPGDRLAEDAIAAALQVSRNTLREAFRLLSHEQLLVHELHRGVFVRSLTAYDVREIYQLRRLLECGVLRQLGSEPGSLTAAAQALRAGERAAAAQRWWPDVGTANSAFHAALVALAGSARLDEVMRGLLAELRLVFAVMADPQGFHAPYLARNREILARLETGDGPGTADLLERYLRDAERQLVGAYGSGGGLAGTDVPVGEGAVSLPDRAGTVSRAWRRPAPGLPPRSS